MEIHELLKHLCCFILALSTCVIEISASQCSKPETFSDNFIINTATIRVEKKISFRKCAEFCLELIICQSLTYSKRNLECRLHYVDRASYPGISNPDANFVYGVRADVKNLVETACSNKVCAANQRCIQLKSKTTVCITYDFDDPRPVSNVAVGKVNEQSTTNGDFVSSRAVDGHWLSDINHGSCSETNLQPNPWWKVDLALPYLIHKVKILNRGDCCGNRLSRFGILIGIRSDSLTQVVYQEQAVRDGAEYQHSFRYPILGRYVQIISYQTNYLNLCEVGIYAKN